MSVISYEKPQYRFSKEIQWDFSGSFSLSTDDSFITDNDFCCHKACGLVNNVQDNIFERASFVLESVPSPLYEKLAPILGLNPLKTPREEGTNRCKLQVQSEEEDKEVEEFIHLIATEIGLQSDLSEDLQMNVGTPRDLTKIQQAAEVFTDNPYSNFLKRNEKAAATSQASQSLGVRSKEISRVIIHDFLAWFRSIGGEDDDNLIIDENVLQDLFQIGFDSPTARAIALRIKEMPMVPETLAQMRNEPEFAVRWGIKKLVKMDIKLEETEPKLFAFGRMLPKEKPSLRFRPPRNEVKKTWTECQRVPPALESMRVVWDGIENLRSTVAFSNWLKNHPEIEPPKYLKEKGLLDINYEEWMQIFKGFEKDFESEGLEGEGRDKDFGSERASGTVTTGPSSGKRYTSGTLIFMPQSYSGMGWK